MNINYTYLPPCNALNYAGRLEQIIKETIFWKYITYKIGGRVIEWHQIDKETKETKITYFR